MRREPRVVPPERRTVPVAQQTPGIHREEAFAGLDRWIGLVRTTPGEWSGWHHHASHDTYFYVLSGVLEFEFGRDGSTIQVGAGDFAHVPTHLVHRERTPGEPVEAVVVRFGSGPAVVNVAGPNAEVEGDER